MSEKCRLVEANGFPARSCDKGACVFWRAVGHLGGEPSEGCAIQHYELLGEEGVAQWLISVKQRVEGMAAPARLA